MLTSQPIIKVNTLTYKYSSHMPEVSHISCNTGAHALPDMSALALGHCALGLVRTYQAMHSCLCYNYYMSFKELKTVLVK